MFNGYNQGEFTIRKLTENGIVFSDGFEIWYSDHTLYEAVPVEDVEAERALQAAVEQADDVDHLQELIDRAPEVLEKIRREEEAWRQKVIAQGGGRPQPSLESELPDEITAEQYLAMIASGQHKVDWSETRRRARNGPS